MKRFLYLCARKQKRLSTIYYYKALYRVLRDISNYAKTATVTVLYKRLAISNRVK